jgi:hypothetical protein
MSEDRFPIVAQILATEPPPHLFHYTSPAGLIGIVQSKELWATHIRFFSDLKELGQAQEYVLLAIRNRLSAPIYKEAYSDADRALLEELAHHIGAGAMGVFVASLTEMRDQLSQWRAYCPPAGGYAIGIPTRQLKAMAAVQGFYLTPCIYEHDLQYALVGEIIDFHVRRNRTPAREGQDLASVWKAAASAFGQDVSRYGPMLKHRSFREEKEWRLVCTRVGVGDPRIIYRPGSGSVVPYCRFALANEQYPHLTIPGDLENSLGVVVGPSTVSGPSQFAIQSILRAHIGPGAWHGVSETPYRGT